MLVDLGSVGVVPLLESSLWPVDGKKRRGMLANVGARFFVGEDVVGQRREFGYAFRGRSKAGDGFHMHGMSPRAMVLCFSELRLYHTAP